MQFFYLLIVASLQAGVFGQLTYNEGEMRLTNTGMVDSGRLEVFRFGVWGTVCGYLEPTAANVACRQFGYSRGEQLPEELYFVTACDDQPIWVKNFICEGYEQRLMDCGFAQDDDIQNCTHADDVYVQCYHDDTVDTTSSYPDCKWQL
ncbi:hypothetical protein CAPTEDRAFT_198525 [Capitella teleta]|uniref:SRCR domain-containing protein n=1 Tax=Capitella teleta TaxID=283909 RepID=R7U6Z8_CAPTE|nr:hypothetical protein CAPTEDRAFT_198525 [Capitella teleta]|eukprot:ELT98900.1 hypothetical protein CAPTEDRAFT_198525 [Capitella teleta]